jgi:hypothetical protein
MKIVNTLIVAAMLSSGLVLGSGAASAAALQSPPAVDSTATSPIHYRHSHKRCYTTVVKRYHQWVRITRCRW